MAEEKRALGYICPECGKSVYGERTAFALNAAAVGLVCDWPQRAEGGERRAGVSCDSALRRMRR